MPFGSTIIELESVGSTNNYAAKMLRTSDVADGTVVLSRFQTEGRGQRGTTWQSEPGVNLLSSIVLKPQDLLAVDQFKLNEAVCLGIVDGLIDGFGVEAMIKWPNDILVKGLKLAGILIECGLRGAAVDYAVVGMGMNVNQSRFPSEFKATSINRILGEEVTPRDVLLRLLPFIEARYDHISDGRQLEADYLANLWGYEKQLYYRAEKEVFRGEIVGLGQHGELQLRTESGAVRTYGFKQIELIGEHL